MAITRSLPLSFRPVAIDEARHGDERKSISTMDDLYGQIGAPPMLNSTRPWPRRSSMARSGALALSLPSSIANWSHNCHPPLSRAPSSH
ncbi:hypothetical protein NL676_004220 [Syzygium grande]|nr:hypothetical protein NL676_004220 [Syzygium grande]